MTYFDIPAINWSTLKWMRESALHYRYRLAVPQEDTPALALGRATHTLVFEPEKFEAEYTIWNDGTRRGKEWDAFTELHADQTILREQDVELVTELAESVRRHPLVQTYLDGGEFERIVTWTDPGTGLACKAKPDWILPERRILLDLKTCVSAQAHRFGAAAARYGYHMQLAHYATGIEHGLGWRPKRVLLVAVEKEPPHDVSVFELAEDDMYVATVEVYGLLQAVKVCRETNTWPGRYTEEQALQLPAWVTGDDEEENVESFDLA